MGLKDLFGKREKFIDPVCGMTVDPKTAAGKEVHEGHTFYFCNSSCLEAFRQDPHRYGHPAH